MRLWEQVGVAAGTADDAEGLALSVDVGRPDDALVAQVGLARVGTTVTVLVWQGHSQEVPAADSVSPLLGTAVDRLGAAAD